jgi:hypothetical protein
MLTATERGSICGGGRKRKKITVAFSDQAVSYTMAAVERRVYRCHSYIKETGGTTALPIAKRQSHYSPKQNTIPQ